MSFTDTVLQKLKAIPGWTATAEHVSLLREILSAREQELDKCRAECNRLRQENEQLRQQTTVTEEFTKYRGLLWLRLDAKTVEPAPYCTKCQSVMVHFPPAEAWCCDTCNVSAPYVEHPQAVED